MSCFQMLSQKNRFHDVENGFFVLNKFKLLDVYFKGHYSLNAFSGLYFS